MSYEIVYSRNFIKTSRGILPIVYSGSNNCYECDNKRREHIWSCLYFNFGFYSENEIMNKIQKYIGGEYQQHFILNGKWVDDKGLINFYKNGIKNAKTIKEMQENCIVYGLRNTKYRFNSILCSVIDYGKDYNDKTLNVLERFINNEEELLKWYDEAIEYKNKSENKDRVYLHCNLATCNKIVYVEKDKKEKVIKGRCVIKKDKKWYEGKNYCGYSNINSEEVIVFDNQEEAKKYLMIMQEKKYVIKGLKIVSYDDEIKKIEQNKYVIKYDNGYYVRKAKYGFRYCSYMCSSVMKTTKEKAIKIMEDLKNRFNYNFEVVEVV